MAKMNIDLDSALTLYRAACAAKAGDMSLVQFDLEEALKGMYPELHRLAGNVEKWETQKTTSGVDTQVLSGFGWKVSFKIASDTGEPETALIDRDDDSIYVLEGDHRQAFEQASKDGMRGMLRVYLDLAAQHVSQFSKRVDDETLKKYGLER